MQSWACLIGIALLALGGTGIIAAGQAQAPQDWAIAGVQVADGTGAALRVANVRVAGDTSCASSSG
jgi:hypothetical protein